MTESSPPDRPARHWAWLVVVALLLLGAVLCSRHTTRPEPEPRVIRSDSVADAAAVGMCALNRDTGNMEGRIVGIASPAPDEPARYRVRRLDNPAAEYLMFPTDVQVVRCP